MQCRQLAELATVQHLALWSALVIITTGLAELLILLVRLHTMFGLHRSLVSKQSRIGDRYRRNGQ